MNEDQRTMLKNMGALSYSCENIAMILGVSDLEEFELEFNNPKSDTYKIYHQGQAEAKFMLDLKLLQMAKDGDLKAMDKLANAKAKAEAIELSNARKRK